MAEKMWHASKQRHCNHAGGVVSLETLVVLPAEFLPDQPPRITAHRCSRGMQCNLFTKPSCVWSGTNPNYDPFAE